VEDDRVHCDEIFLCQPASLIGHRHLKAFDLDFRTLQKHLQRACQLWTSSGEGIEEEGCDFRYHISSRLVAYDGERGFHAFCEASV
jgi:hypothetical protein